MEDDGGRTLAFTETVSNGQWKLALRRCAPSAVVGIESDDIVTVRVGDNGPGISPLMRETLFEQSQRADHGLGLYLVRELVVRYGGNIDLVETGQDGSTFEILLHRATETEKASEAPTYTAPPFGLPPLSS